MSWLFGMNKGNSAQLVDAPQVPVMGDGGDGAAGGGGQGQNQGSKANSLQPDLHLDPFTLHLHFHKNRI